MRGEGKVFILNSVKDTVHIQSFIFMPKGYLKIKLQCCTSLFCWHAVLKCWPGAKWFWQSAAKKNNLRWYRSYQNTVEFIDDRLLFLFWLHACKVHNLYVPMICVTDMTYPFACYVISFLIWQHDSESVGNLLIILFSYRGCVGGWRFCRWQDREECQHYCCDCERVIELFLILQHVKFLVNPDL